MQVKVFIFIAMCIACTLATKSESQYQDSFTRWMQQHQRTYRHYEFRQKYSVYKSNLDFIEQHNKENPHMFLAMNEYGDLTHSEFQNVVLGLKARPARTRPNKLSSTFKAANYTVPASYDWRKKGAVTDVKNQGQCGSCWSFSATGAVEACHYLKNGELVSLSEQNLIDCSSSYDNNGCDGGLMDNAFNYIIDNKGIDTEASYPYKAVDGTCKFSAKDVGATLTGFRNIAEGDENALLQALATAPVSVAIDASRPTFQFYSSGVYFDAKCSSSDLDHGVLAVGWGSDSVTGQDYWVVKNSWGPTWGNEGYILMARNKKNHCGIASMATIPTC